MSDHTKKLVIPSHLRLDSLSLNSISTGLTPKGEIKGPNGNKGLVSTRSVSGQYSDVQKRLSVQLPSCRSLRTSLRINRNSAISQLGKSNARPGTSTETGLEKQPRNCSNSSRVSRTNVTTPKGFDFATSERAEQRLKHGSGVNNRSSSSGSRMLRPELGLSLHQIHSGRIPAAPMSTRSASSIGAESRISSLSRSTTVPKPFSFATDARAASKSRELCERLGSLRERFNEEVLTKNKEFNEDKRINTILESIRNFNLSGRDSSSSLNKASGDTSGAKGTLEEERQVAARRNTTVPKTPKFATQMRSESKKAQLRGVLDSMLSQEKESSSSWSRSDTAVSSSKPTLGSRVRPQNNKGPSAGSSEPLYEPSSEPRETQGQNTARPPELHAYMQPQRLPKLRGFLSMNSLAHLGRQSFGSLEGGGRENCRRSEENSPILNCVSAVSGMSSIRKINEANTNIPSNWKFQATVARKQLRQFTGLEEADFSLKEFESCNQPESIGFRNDETARPLTEEDLKTPLPRTYR